MLGHLRWFLALAAGCLAFFGVLFSTLSLIVCSVFVLLPLDSGSLPPFRPSLCSSSCLSESLLRRVPLPVSRGRRIIFQ